MFATCQANPGLILPYLLASTLPPPQHPANQQLKEAARQRLRDWLVLHPEKKAALDLLAGLKHIRLGHFALENEDAVGLLRRFPGLRSVDLQGNGLTCVGDQWSVLESANFRDNKIDRISFSVAYSARHEFNIFCNPWTDSNC